MAKKASTKKDITKRSKSGKIKPNILIDFWDKHTNLVIFGLLGLAALGYWIFTYQIPKMQEKKGLESAYSQLETIVSNIAEKNSPDSKEGYKYCSYQSSKLGDGDRYCFVGFEINFNDIGATEANKIKNESAKFVSNNSLYNPSSKDEVEFPEKKDELIGSIWQDIDNTNYSCGSEYIYPGSQRQSKNLKIFISCSKARAIAEHYEIRK